MRRREEEALAVGMEITASALALAGAHELGLRSLGEVEGVDLVFALGRRRGLEDDRLAIGAEIAFPSLREPRRDLADVFEVTRLVDGDRVVLRGNRRRGGRGPEEHGE